MTYFPKTQIQGESEDTTAQNILIDGSTHAIIGIDYPHHELHSGSHFTFSTYSAAVASGAALGFLIVVPDDTKWPHLIGKVSGTFVTTVELYENCTHSTDSEQNVWNNNRNSLTPNLTRIYTHQGDGADGTLIFAESFGVSTGVGINMIAGGGTARADSEWILKQDTAYLLKVTSGTDDNRISLSLTWYEHEDEEALHPTPTPSPTPTYRTPTPTPTPTP